MRTRKRETKRKIWSLLLAASLILACVGAHSPADTVRAGVVAENPTEHTERAAGQAENRVASAAAIMAKAAQAETVLADYIYKDTFQAGQKLPGVQSVNEYYTAFSLKQSGYPADAFYNAAYEKLEEQMAVIAKGGSYASSYTYWDYDENWNPTKEHVVEYEIDRAYLSTGMGCSNLAKIIMFVNAMGKNPMDVGGINLLDIIMSKEAYNASDAYILDATILLAVLGTKNPVVSADDAHYTINEMITKTVEGIEEQYGSVEWGADSLVIQIQALANVAQAFPEVEGVFRFLEETESGQASFGNVWTQSQVITAIAMFGISPVEDGAYHFIKGDVTVLDDALRYVKDDGTMDAEMLGYQPEQLLRALTSAIRVVNGEDNIYSSGTKYAYTAPVKPGPTDALASPTPGGGKNTPAPVVTNAPAKKLKKTAIKSLRSTGKKKVTLKIKKVTGAKGYRIQYSTDKKFKKSVKKLTSTKTTVQIKKLKSKKVYYFRVQAYKGKVKSVWSAKKRVKVK